MTGQLQVTTLEANTLSANVITAGNTTVNSTGMFLSGSNGVVNTSAIRVISGASNTTLLSVISTPSINVGGTSYTSLTTDSINTQIFTNPAVSNFWTKPSWATTGNELVIVHMWGGGGGGCATGIPGTSVFGGAGGTNDNPGSIPGGGGGRGGGSGGSGARGEVRVWVIGPGSTTTGP